MKKLLAILLALVMLLSLAACGGEEEETSSRRKNRKSTEATTEETTQEVTEETEEVVERDYESPYTEFEELDVELIDDEYITLSITDLDDGDWGAVCGVRAENKTSTNISVYSLSVAVNDRMTYDSFYLDLEVEDEGEEELYFYDYEDQDDITRISMAINLYDVEDYEFSECYLIDIYPQGKAAHKYDKPDREGLDTLVDEDELFVAVTEYQQEEDSFHVLYRAINDSEELLSLSLNPVSLNGFGCMEYGGGYILPDTYAEDTIWCMGFTDLRELGMEDVTRLDMELDVFTEDDEELLKEDVTLYPKGKSKAEEFVYAYEDDDVVIYEDDRVKLTQVKYDTDEYDNGYVYFILENKTGEYVYVYADVVKMNGTEAYASISFESTKGLDTYELLHLAASELEELSGKKLTSMELALEIYDEDFETLYEGTAKFDIK